eukprot:6214563-Pleurochrysis_carterae.AAC.4
MPRPKFHTRTCSYVLTRTGFREMRTARRRSERPGAPPGPRPVRATVDVRRCVHEPMPFQYHRLHAGKYFSRPEYRHDRPHISDKSKTRLFASRESVLAR